jgi:hypothetical protein
MRKNRLTELELEDDDDVLVEGDEPAVLVASLPMISTYANTPLDALPQLSSG